MLVVAEAGKGHTCSEKPIVTKQMSSLVEWPQDRSECLRNVSVQTAAHKVD